MALKKREARIWGIVTLVLAVVSAVAGICGFLPGVLTYYGLERFETPNIRTYFLWGGLLAFVVFYGLSELFDIKAGCSSWGTARFRGPGTEKASGSAGLPN